MAIDHGDREDELDLLLECVQGLTCDGADGEHGAEPGRYRRRPADGAGRRDAPARGTDELHRKLVTGEVGVLRAQRLDAGPDRGLARADDLGEATQQRLHLDGQTVQLHRDERNRALSGSSHPSRLIRTRRFSNGFPSFWSRSFRANVRSCGCGRRPQAHCIWFTPPASRPNGALTACLPATALWGKPL